MKQKNIIHSAQKSEMIDHKNARTSHQSMEKTSKKKMSFFGDRASRQFVNNEMIKDGLDSMHVKIEMEAVHKAKEDETKSFTPW
ncbi:hypothetical protein LEAN103870_09215 [Legionella anisa]|uniref:Uncharacterized protein n=1 Tax=Legionella anisa TaxID=28082 RepID=A0AAX0WYK3_9GAMM|nr:hypothetical protein [Legionella anisa]AWN72814.1 hypothetical protein DLD14_02575 [Legionella anisa]KTC70741.1 hypothetical protein Lani_2288 [Legionella anisa]MBN5934710.1 hypothetical protein [Legionella anisa]MCW8423613.1 hypothetical protein [Legionella anisa]MCW8447133.1 hypothetical protein [Legionella anisa]